MNDLASDHPDVSDRPHEWLKLALTLVVGAAVLTGRFLVISPMQAKWVILRLGYWLVAGTFIAYLVLLVRTLLRSYGKGFTLTRHKWGVFSVLAATAFLQLNEPHELKVLFDEFVISGTARNMHFLREPTYPAKAHYLNGRLNVMDVGIDKRPFFFPFVLSLVHDLTGYRLANVFVLNGLLSGILFGLIYAVGCLLNGTRLGVFGIWMFASLPLLAQNATGGGYELLNLCLITAIVLTGICFLRKPGLEGMNLLVLTAVLLAQTRYESILYVLAVGGIIALKWWKEKRIALTWFAVVSPILLLTPLLVNLVFMAMPKEAFQTKADESFFAFHYLIPSLEHAVFYLFSVSFDGTNSFGLSLVGVISLVFLVILIAREGLAVWKSADLDAVLFLVLGVVLCNTLLALCNFWGFWDDPVVSRFSLALQLFFVFACLRVIQEFLKSRTLPVSAILVVIGNLVFFTIPASARSFASTDIITSREYSWLQEVLSKKSPEDTLTISGSSLGPILFNMPSVPIETANIRLRQLKACLDGEYYKEIIIMERFRINPKTMKEEQADVTHLSPAIVVEPIAARRFRPNMVTRIGRVVEVKVDSVINRPKPGDYETDQQYFAYLLSKLP